MKNLLPVTSSDRRRVRSIHNNNLRRYSPLPASTHSMTTTPHEYSRRFNHVVCKLSLRPIDDNIAVLLLQPKAKLLSLSRHSLLQFLVRPEKLFLRQILIDW